MTETPKQSDQLPEEGAAREAAQEQAAREAGRTDAQDTDDLGYRDTEEERAYDERETGGD